MAQVYFHVFARSSRSGDWTWFHEASRDTRYDASDDSASLRRDGYKVKIVRSEIDPMTLLAGLNADSTAYA